MVRQLLDQFGRPAFIGDMVPFSSEVPNSGKSATDPSRKLPKQAVSDRFSGRRSLPL